MNLSQKFTYRFGPALRQAWRQRFPSLFIPCRVLACLNFSHAARQRSLVKEAAWEAKQLIY
ncbi:hypothetical protein E2C01_070507 [Portunus trituberculatus]|uniref:Uncharacterized protein n=1 Tax=Portunus trituberculatus TaxID=210409 RepID=A0A5B7HXG8_PORTR|nr:hypothetical protein [Portunus trituberculatus]